MMADPVKQFETLLTGSDFLFVVCKLLAPVPTGPLTPTNRPGQTFAVTGVLFAYPGSNNSKLSAGASPLLMARRSL